MAKKKIRKRKHRKARKFLSTGSTLLNCACTDNPLKGFETGYYYLLVGTSRSGKTWLSMSCLAEAATNEFFDKHEFIYDDVERGRRMDVRRFFGRDVKERLKTVHSYFIEDFYFRLDTLLEAGKPFIYILDSMDTLDSKQAEDKFQEQKEAHYKKKEVAGSYGDGKARYNSGNLRKVIGKIEHSDSILIVINQARYSFKAFGGMTRSGGSVMQYLASHEIWSDIKGKIYKTVRGKKMMVGVDTALTVKKNRSTGKERPVLISILNTYGIDDINSCINYLVTMKHWERSKKSDMITAPEFEFKGTQKKLATVISDNNRERELALIVGEVWNEIEDELTEKRKPRYV